jgi:hypothetical protein
MNPLQQQLEPGLAHDRMMRTIELSGRRVAPSATCSGSA